MPARAGDNTRARTGERTHEMLSAQTTPDTSTFSAQTTEPPKKLIWIAWFIEVIAILVSLSLAVHPLLTAQDSLLNGWLGAAPFLVIAAAEISKIPLVEALFRMKGVFLRWVAFFGIVIVCLNTFYTVSNGFERAHNTKTKNIEEVKRTKIAAESEIDIITQQREKAVMEKTAADQKFKDIVQNETGQQAVYRDINKDLLTQKRRAVSTRMLADIARANIKLKADLAAESARLADQIKSFDLSLAKYNAEALTAKNRMNELVADNQIYRFAAMIFRHDDPAQMTGKELNTFCLIWFGIVAFAVSVLGPFLALCYYRIKYQDARLRTAWDALLRAARRLLIRLARRNKIVKVEEREIETIVEKPVEVEVFRDVVREVPVETVVVREVEVVKEVPVEKVVIQEVEVVREVSVDRVVIQDVIKEVPVDRIVPYEKLVEVEKKEIVYVPIFTNDPDILRAQAA